MKSELEIKAHNYDQRIRALVTGMNMLCGLDYVTEHLTLSILKEEYQVKLDNVNKEILKLK
jgi:ferritin-like protein